MLKFYRFINFINYARKNSYSVVCQTDRLIKSFCGGKTGGKIMPVISMKQLLEAGVHFGHQTRRWNPKMGEYIFTERNGIYIIDLQKTVRKAEEAYMFIRNMAMEGGTVLFVGTKKQAQDIIRNEALRCGMPYVTHRWLGGMLTNFSTVRKSIARMEEINKMRVDGTYDNITKKERLMLDREYEKLEKVMGGISGLGRTPGAIFVVDIVKESIAISEAMKLNIPIFAIVDTNCDPDIPDYIIPANDDAAKAIHLITANVADAIIEGAAEREVFEEEQAVMDAMEKKSTELSGDEEEGSDGPRRRRRRGTGGPGAGAGAGGAGRGPRKG